MDRRVLAILEKLKAYSPKRVILFGSQATGEADEYSDTDLVVIKETPKRFLERLKEVDEILGMGLSGVDIFVYTPEEWERMIEWGNPLAQQVLKEGKVIYEED
jgi:predicted nucleotidyltransferase